MIPTPSIHSISKIPSVAGYTATPVLHTSHNNLEAGTERVKCKDSIRIFVSVRITVHEINTKIQNLTAKLELDFCCTRTHTHTEQDLVISVN